MSAWVFTQLCEGISIQRGEPADLWRFSTFSSHFFFFHSSSPHPLPPWRASLCPPACCFLTQLIFVCSPRLLLLQTEKTWGHTCGRLPICVCVCFESLVSLFLQLRVRACASPSQSSEPNVFSSIPLISQVHLHIQMYTNWFAYWFCDSLIPCSNGACFAECAQVNL